MPPACPTLCDSDCDEVCHEVHVVRDARYHQPRDCPALLGLNAPFEQTDVGIEEFPLVIELFRTDTREVVWSKQVTHPQGVWIPAMAREIGVPVGTRITSPRGVTEMLPDGNLS